MLAWMEDEKTLILLPTGHLSLVRNLESVPLKPSCKIQLNTGCDSPSWPPSVLSGSVSSDTHSLCSHYNSAPMTVCPWCVYFLFLKLDSKFPEGRSQMPCFPSLPASPAHCRPIQLVPMSWARELQFAV